MTAIAIDRTILDARDNPARFRGLIRDWLARTVPPGWHAAQAGAAEEEQLAFQRWWFGELGSIGMTTAHWARAWGGEGLGMAEQVIFYEEIARAGAPCMAIFVVTLNHLPATLFAAGTSEQRARYIDGARAGDLWCQGFSEPGAGSDLASLKTRAVRDGDDYVINGQKVWTSYGQYARHCLLLARTDPDRPRHAGISYFIMDMDSPGISLRPIRQSNGLAEFNEMFLDDVRIPVNNRIGEENGGWPIAQTTLSAERGLIIFEQSERLRHFLRMLVAARPAWLADVENARAFMRLFADSEALALMLREMLHANEAHGEMANQAAPMLVKLHYATLLQAFGALMVRVNGLEGQIMRPDIPTGSVPGGNWMFDYLSSWMWTISGGTNEIIRTLIAERLLGLPRG